MSRFFHATMAVLVLTVFAITAYGMWASGLRVPVAQVLPKIGMYSLVLVGAAFYKRRQADRFVAALMIVFWMGLVSDLHVYPMFLAGRQSVVYHDELLVKADRMLGLEVTDVLAWIEAYPEIKQQLDAIYYTLVFLMTAALLSTTLLGRLRAAQEYVIAMVCAVALTFPLFAVFQAQGPFTYYGYPPSPAQADYLRTLAALKSQETFTMDLRYASGLITFPSFHTILALLAARALWSIPYVRWFGLAWAGLIVLSTVTTGWHYIVDLAAGGVIAALSVMGAGVFSRFETKYGTEGCAPGCYTTFTSSRVLSKT
jgi:membrane-associated phospholipid phosphatase